MYPIWTTKVTKCSKSKHVLRRRSWSLSPKSLKLKMTTRIARTRTLMSWSRGGAWAMKTIVTDTTTSQHERPERRWLVTPGHLTQARHHQDTAGQLNARRTQDIDEKEAAAEAAPAAAAAADDDGREAPGKTQMAGNVLLPQANRNRRRALRLLSAAAPTSTRVVTLSHGRQNTTLHGTNTCRRNIGNG
jgi:hypothetical protein